MTSAPGSPQHATPGIGILDAGLIGALALYGLPITHAAAAVLVYHAIAFWIPTLGGTVAYGHLRRHLENTPSACPADEADPPPPAGGPSTLQQVEQSFLVDHRHA